MKNSMRRSYALINKYTDHVTVELYDTNPSFYPSSQIKLKDVTVHIQNNILSIVGTQIVYDYCLYKTFIEDFKENKPDELEYKYKYKTILDWLFRKPKKPCISSGYYKTNKTIPFDMLTSNWELHL